METTHILACLDYLVTQAKVGVKVTRDGDEDDIRANAAVVRRVIEELAKADPALPDGGQLLRLIKTGSGA